jgi:hypothetical protein
MRTCPNLLILNDSFPVTGLCDQEDFQAKFPRKSVFPKTFDRRRQFQPKFGPPTKKWHKLSDESEIAGALEPAAVFFRQAQAWRVWRQGRTNREPASIKIVSAA